MKNKLVIYLIVLLLGELGYVAIDIYLPSLPAITHSLASSDTLTKLTISLYLLGFGVSQLIYGPLSDYFGRRVVIIFGLMIALIASLGCIFAQSMDLLIFCRLLQGFGTGAGTIIARTILMDMFTGKDLLKATAYYSFAAAQVITLVPIIGGHIQAIVGWRGNFVFIFLYACSSLLLLWKFLPETRNKEAMARLEQLGVKTVCKNYIFILKHKLFILCALCSSITLASIIAYAGISPFLFQKILGLTPIEYGYISLVICVAMMVGCVLSHWLANWGSLKLSQLGSTGMVLGAGLLLCEYFLGGNNLFFIMIALLIFFLGANLVFTGTAISALKEFSHMTGSAGALFGSLQVLISSGVSTMTAMIPQNNLLVLALIFFVVGGVNLYLLVTLQNV